GAVLIGRRSGDDVRAGAERRAEDRRAGPEVAVLARLPRDRAGEVAVLGVHGGRREDDRLPGEEARAVTGGLDRDDRRDVRWPDDDRDLRAADEAAEVRRRRRDVVRADREEVGREGRA